MRRSLLPLLLALGSMATGCAHQRIATVWPQDEGPLATGANAPPLVRVGEPVGLAIAERAQKYLDHGGTLLRRDCSGLVETVFGDLGLAVPVASDLHANGVAQEYVGLRRQNAVFTDRPLPGDLAFFHDTYDRNRDGKVDDPLTHVAIVASLDVDGTVTLIHFGSHGVASFHMNLAEPGRHRDSLGRRLNDYLRVKRRRDPPHTPYLSGQLFTAFGRAPEHLGGLARR